jgi:hypothetical protein
MWFYKCYIVQLIWIIQLNFDTTVFVYADTTNSQSLPNESSIIASSYWCNEDHDDYVHTIPGYIPIQPPSCWYSGYVSYEIAGQMIHTHYTLQTAELLSSTTTISNVFRKPLIYWSSYVIIPKITTLLSETFH